MTLNPKTEPDHELTGYPPGVPYIIGNEGCERFSFYGMKTILQVWSRAIIEPWGGKSPTIGHLAFHLTPQLQVATREFGPLALQTNLDARQFNPTPSGSYRSTACTGRGSAPQPLKSRDLMPFPARLPPARPRPGR